MRPIAWVSAVLALGLGSVAFAQPRLVVDPWPRSKNGASAGFREQAPARSAPVPTEIRDPWAPAQEASKVASDAHVISHIASGLSDEPDGPLKRAATRTRRAATWSARFVEIVDPWQHLPRAAATYDTQLIVDPWAPSVRRAQRRPRQ